MSDEQQSIVGPMPQPLPTGTDTYYRRRVADFVRRHPNGCPPSYYLEYGDKCLHQFRAAGPEFSPGGQEWLESTLRLLQEAIEERLRQDPVEFDRLELDDQGFRDFAFSTHAQAYIEGGIFTLPGADLWRILRTPDMTDVVSPDGIAEILELISRADRDDIAHIVAPASDSETHGPVTRFLGWVVRRTRRPQPAAK